MRRRGTLRTDLRRPQQGANKGFPSRAFALWLCDCSWSRMFLLDYIRGQRHFGTALSKPLKLFSLRDNNYECKTRRKCREWSQRRGYNSSISITVLDHRSTTKCHKSYQCQSRTSRTRSSPWKLCQLIRRFQGI